MQKLKSILYNIIAPMLRMLLANSITGKVIKGTQLKLYYERSQHLGFLFSGQIEYEKEFSSMVLEHLRPGNIVFEIGSNIGQYSMVMASKVGENGMVVCVEPDSDNFAFLSFNVLKNHCSNVRLINAAVSDKEGYTTFYKDTITGGRMGSMFRQYSGTHFQGRSEEVKTMTLQQLTDQYGTPDFVKVDVEGAETLVFSDPVAIHEGTIFLIEVREETKEHIFSIFQSKGFSIFLLERNLEKIGRANDIPGFANLLIKQ
jgi:FkbM family methyltransferase